MCVAANQSINFSRDFVSLSLLFFILGTVISSINKAGEESRALSLTSFKCLLLNFLPVDPILGSGKVSLS